MCDDEDLTEMRTGMGLRMRKGGVFILYVVLVLIGRVLPRASMLT